jgi:hypothetical protein
MADTFKSRMNCGPLIDISVLEGAIHSVGLIDLWQH